MVADMIEPCGYLADIGCDHGFMALYLINNKIIDRALCTDINEGPLKRAKEHIEAAGYSDCVDTLLSDGLHNITKDFRKIDASVICGMGGLMGVKILFDRNDLFEKMDYIYLQLQSDLNLVRLYLFYFGYEIVSENVVFEDGKFYTAMKIKHVKEKINGFSNLDEVVSFLRKKDSELTVEEAVEFYYPYYEDTDGKVFEDFLLFMIDKYENVKNGMNEKSNNYSEVIRELNIMKEAYSRYFLKNVMKR